MELISLCILVRQTFAPPPNSDWVFGVQSNCDNKFTIMVEVNTAHTHWMGPLKDGVGLLCLNIPHMDRSVFPNLTSGNYIIGFGIWVEG